MPTPTPAAHDPLDADAPQVVIMGAGMAGICMGITLKRAGIERFVILEQSAGVGGTWWDNRYPGAQCDVPSHLYSYSFELNPDWSRVFAPSAEIQRYVEHCVRKYDLSRHLRLGTRVTAARYDAGARCWRLSTDRGRELNPRIFVMSLGPLNHPRYPAGVEAFAGPVMHTARWDPAVEWRGKRVAVIGSAASAVQVVPALAPEAAALTVYQRTPSWLVARPDRPYRAAERRMFRVPGVARAYRWWLNLEFEARYPAFLGRGLAHRLLTRMATAHLEAQVPDPARQARLRPEYPIGCKRILVASDFYPALARPNVELVTQAASGFTAGGVVAGDGTVRPADVIVCATGFDTLDPLAALPVIGSQGRTLAAAWADGPEAYRGVLVAGFPNLFLLLGPNSATGHTSVLISIEAQARYTLACIRELARRGAASLDVRPDAMARHNHELQRRLARTVWASRQCRSWYKTPGGKIVATYPGPINRYAFEMRRPHCADFVFERAPTGSGAG